MATLVATVTSNFGIGNQDIPLENTKPIPKKVKTHTEEGTVMAAINPDALAALLDTGQIVEKGKEAVAGIDRNGNEYRAAVNDSFGIGDKTYVLKKGEYVTIEDTNAAVILAESGALARKDAEI